MPYDPYTPFIWTEDQPTEADAYTATLNALESPLATTTLGSPTAPLVDQSTGVPSNGNTGISGTTPTSAPSSSASEALPPSTVPATTPAPAEIPNLGLETMPGIPTQAKETATPAIGAPAAPATNLPGPGAPNLPNLGNAYQAASGAAQQQQTANTGVSDAYRQALLSVLNQTQQPPSVEGNTPLSAQAATYRNARLRESQRNRASMAERFAQEGLNSGGQGSGAFDTGITGLNESAGRDIAGYEAGLVGQETQARRQQLMQALQLANAVGARSEAAQLQRELALLSGSLNQENAGSQLGLNYAQLEAELNRQALMAALGFGGSMG